MMSPLNPRNLKLSRVYSPKHLHFCDSKAINRFGDIIKVDGNIIKSGLFLRCGLVVLVERSCRALYVLGSFRFMFELTVRDFVTQVQGLRLDTRDVDLMHLKVIRFKNMHIMSILMVKC